MLWTKHWLYYYFVESKFKIKLYEPLHCEHTSCNHCKRKSEQEEFVQTQLVLRENANIFMRERKKFARERNIFARECKSFAREHKDLKNNFSSHPKFFPPPSRLKGSVYCSACSL